ncbi:MAG: hypothetical protein GY774_24465 [Planctomycetes bacterium]|nr:hypothetical protein [Planctomycetota bacterium]
MSLDFTADDGSKVYGTFTSGIPANTDWSLFIWVKRSPTLNAGAWETIGALTADTSSNTDQVKINCPNSSTKLNFTARDTGDNTVALTGLSTGDTDDEWIPILISHDYTDGSTRSTKVYATVSENTATNTAIAQFASGAKNALILGKEVDYNPGTWSGLLSHACVWNGKALTAGNFTSLIAGIDPTTIEAGSVHSHYPLISDLADASGNGEVTLTHSGTAVYSADEPFTLAAGVTITNVDTDNIIQNKQQNVVTTVTGAGATQGTGSKVLTSGAITSAFTIDSGADTSIQGDPVQGNIPFTTASHAVFVKVTDDSASTDSLEIEYNPEDDTAVIELLNPTEGDGQVDITGTPATADLYHHDDILYLEDGTTPTAYTVSIDATGKYTIGGSPPDGTYKFKVRHWSAGWDVNFLSLGAVQTVIIESLPSVYSGTSQSVTPKTRQTTFDLSIASIAKLSKPRS